MSTQFIFQAQETKSENKHNNLMFSVPFKNGISNGHIYGHAHLICLISFPNNDTKII